MSGDSTDLTRHMVSTRTHFWDENGSPGSRAVTFAEMVEEFRHSLAGDSGEPSGTTRTQALVAAGMLQEFADRLRISLSTGAVDSEAEKLAVMVDEMSKLLRYPRRSAG